MTIIDYLVSCASLRLTNVSNSKWQRFNVKAYRHRVWPLKYWRKIDAERWARKAFFFVTEMFARKMCYLLFGYSSSCRANQQMDLQRKVRPNENSLFIHNIRVWTYMPEIPYWYISFYSPLHSPLLRLSLPRCLLLLLYSLLTMSSRVMSGIAKSFTSVID